MEKATLKIPISVILEDLKDFLGNLQEYYERINDIDSVNQIDFFIICLDQIIIYFKKLKKVKKIKKHVKRTF